MINELANNPKSYFWTLNVAGWAGYAMLNYLMGIAGNDKPYDYIEPSLMYALFGVFLTYGLRAVYKTAWNMRPAFSLILSGIGAIAAAAIFAGVRSFIYAHIYQGLQIGAVPAIYYFHPLELTLALYVIGTWSGLYFGIKYYQMAQSQREQMLKATSTAQKAQLEMLRFQLNPHFLFNTLNSISTLVLEGENRTANLMVERFGHFLRYSLNRDPMQKTRLDEELEALDLYLGVEKIRFDDRLRVKLEVQPEALEAGVPRMILHPLIENAIKYAVATKESGSRITIAAGIEDDMLCLSVADTGPGISDPGSVLSNVGDGAGLANTRERLQVLYGDAHRIRIENLQPHGLIVEICIPFERSGQ